MALFRKKDAGQKTEQKNAAQADRYAELKHAGRIMARIIDARSGLRTIPGVYVVRMLDEGERRLFMNDYTPTIGRVVGDVVFLSAQGEHAYHGIRGFYKLQHNEFTLLIEGYLNEEIEQA